MKVFFQKILAGKEKDFQSFLPLSVFYPFNKEQFTEMSKVAYQKIWSEFEIMQENSFLDNYVISDMPEQEWGVY